MEQDKHSFLCESCPAKGIRRVDYDVSDSCLPLIVNSFKQARRDGISNPGLYRSNDDLAQQTANGVRYWNPRTNKIDFIVGSYDAAALGAQCAKIFLQGECQQTLVEILGKSVTK